MLAPTHKAAGTLSCALLSLFLNSSPQTALLLIVCGYAASSLPDIDCPQSTISRQAHRFAPFAAIIVFVTTEGSFTNKKEQLIVSLLCAAALAYGPLVLNLTIGHRSATHSLVLTSALYAVALLLLPRHGLGREVVSGIYLGTICGGVVPDLLTPGGVEAGWPLTRKRFRLLPAFMAPRTGGMFERFIFRPLLCAALVLILIRYSLNLLDRLETLKAFTLN